MKLALDYAPVLLFFGTYLASGLYVATAVLIVSLFGVVAVYRLWKREWHRLHLFTAALAAVFGGLTLAIRDPAFIMFKPTALYGVLALVLLGSHFIGDRVLLQRIPQAVIDLPDAVWRRVNLVWVGFFVGCALLNLWIAAAFDEATWVTFKSFGFTALIFVFLLGHAPFLSRYLPDETGTGST